MRSATLIIHHVAETKVLTSEHLLERLRDLESLAEGARVLLSRGPKHYVLAQRHDSGWAVEKRQGPFWTRQSFAGPMSLTGQGKNLSPADVRAICQEFFEERPFSRMILGAG